MPQAIEEFESLVSEEVAETVRVELFNPIGFESLVSEEVAETKKTKCC